MSARQNVPSLLDATLLLNREEKQRIERHNRQLLELDLLEGRLDFESRPRVVNVQFSNFCNMSCIMCYDGVNPPLEIISQEIIDRVAQELLPAASVLVPFANSEPLTLTWDITRQLASRYGLELDIVTNVQFLDEKKFHELEPHVSAIRFSIDSHIEGVFDWIRLRANTSKVFGNLPVAAKLCREHDIEVKANMVFLVENAPFLDGTVEWLADAGVHTVQLLKFLEIPDRHFSDALAHLSPSWIADMKEKMRRVAEEKRIRLVFDLDEKEVFDYLPKDLHFRPTRMNDGWFEKLRRFYPGYCWQWVDSVKVETNGDVYPCCIAMNGDLELGNIQQQSLDEVWNGPEARDLRRGMMTGDVPRLCHDCTFVTGWILDEQSQMDFVGAYEQERLEGRRVPSDRCVLEVPDPPHMLRSTTPPVFHWTRPEQPVDRYDLVLALGGENTKLTRVLEIDGGATEYALPEEVWSELLPNMAWWWAIWGVRDDAPEHTVRMRTLRAVVRQVDLPRVPGSSLRY